MKVLDKATLGALNKCVWKYYQTDNNIYHTASLELLKNITMFNRIGELCDIPLVGAIQLVDSKPEEFQDLPIDLEKRIQAIRALSTTPSFREKMKAFLLDKYATVIDSALLYMAHTHTGSYHSSDVEFKMYDLPMVREFVSKLDRIINNICSKDFTYKSFYNLGYEYNHTEGMDISLMYGTLKTMIGESTYKRHHSLNGYKYDSVYRTPGFDFRAHMDISPIVIQLRKLLQESQFSNRLRDLLLTRGQENFNFKMFFNSVVDLVNVLSILMGAYYDLNFRGFSDEDVQLTWPDLTRDLAPDFLLNIDSTAIDPAECEIIKKYETGRISSAMTFDIRYYLGFQYGLLKQLNQDGDSKVAIAIK